VRRLPVIGSSVRDCAGCGRTAKVTFDTARGKQRDLRGPWRLYLNAIKQNVVQYNMLEATRRHGVTDWLTAEARTTSGARTYPDSNIVARADMAATTSRTMARTNCSPRAAAASSIRRRTWASCCRCTRPTQENSIQATRKTLTGCFFDETRCVKGLNALRTRELSRRSRASAGRATAPTPSSAGRSPQGTPAFSPGWYAWKRRVHRWWRFPLTRGQCPSALDKLCAVTFPLRWADVRSSFKP
jgi:hypothetical protein